MKEKRERKNTSEVILHFNAAHVTGFRVRGGLALGVESNMRQLYGAKY